MVLTDDLVYLEKGDWPAHREQSHKRALRAAAARAHRRADNGHGRRCTPLFVKLLGWICLLISIGMLGAAVCPRQQQQSLSLAPDLLAASTADRLADLLDGAWSLLTPAANSDSTSEDVDSLCPQQPALRPEDSGLTITEPSQALQASRLGGAVQVDTSVHDDYPPFQDDPTLWSGIFDPLADYLQRTFPAIHDPNGPVKREKVGGVGLLYTWPGSDPALKPLVLAAHQDVVPVDPQTSGQWTHPPFSGYYDEKTGLVWGRGASDDKSSLIALLTAFESLLEAKDEQGGRWVPKRTIVLAFGADEEASGRVAGDLAKHLVDVYGRDGAYMLVDEGGPVIAAADSPFSRTLAVVATAEKGYLDARITVHAPGGHSSEPPSHTAIGRLASLITLIEKNPHESQLNTANPAFQLLTCLSAAQGGDPKLKSAVQDLRKALKKQAQSQRDKRRIERLKQRVLALAPRELRTSFGTTQAVDLISGGVKVNALPEEATAVINHRIDIASSVGEVREWIARVLRPYAVEAGIELDAWGNGTLSYHPDDAVPAGTEGDAEVHAAGLAARHAHAGRRSPWSHLHKHAAKPTVSAPSSSSSSTSKQRKPATRIVLEDAFESALEPAPQTPLKGEAEPWALLQGVIRGVYGEEALVVPDLMGGNTDTKSYWNLTRHIFRFSPGSPHPVPGWLEDGIHTVDEFAPAEGLVYGWRVWVRLIRAVAE